MDSKQTLAAYATNGSETAFRELVAGYIDLVFSTALRLVDGDANRAQEAAQLVFIDLARQAAKLSPDTMLGGWLHRDTCFVASKMMRGERRRRVRERQAAEMKAVNQPDTALTNLAPILDEAINELRVEDREAILLRFYERMDLRSVGAALGSSENAAQKRVSRALDQLRVVLTRRGIALSVAGLGTVLAGEAVTAAPAGLAANITVAALAGAVGGSVPLSVVKAVSLAKLKISAFGVIAAIAVAAPLIVQHQSQIRLREANDSSHQLRNQYAMLVEENQRLSNLVAQASSQTLVGEQLHELLRLRGEVGRLRLDSKEIESLRLENRQLRVSQEQPAKDIGDANTAAVPKPSPLYTRMLKVDFDALAAHLKSSYPVTNGNSTNADFHNAAFRQFLKDSGVEIEAPQTVFMDEKNSTLLVHASLENLDKIEQIVGTLSLEAKSH